MDIDVSRWAAILAALLLIPGLLFLGIVVAYVAFIPKKSQAGERPSAGDAQTQSKDETAS